jgi:hypothetical protein
MDSNDKRLFASQIISAVINQPNIELRIAKDNVELGVRDKQSGGYMTFYELYDYITKYS